MSLRWKIAISVAALAALATLTVGVLSYRSAADRMYAEMDASLTEALTLVRRDAGGGDEWNRRGSPLLYQAQLLAADGSVRLTTIGGWRPSAAALSVVGRPRAAVVETISIQATRHRARTTGFADGAVQVARPLGEIDRVLRSLRIRIVVVVALVTAAATLLGSLIAAQVTAALRRLTATADTVRTTGRLDVDVPRDGNDEVSRLGAAFGSMLASLDRSRAEQRRLVQDAGHELRTPLTSLRTNLDVLRRHPDLPVGDRQQIMADLHGEVAEMVDLVEEIVTVASGVAADEAATEFSLGDVVGAVVERFQRRTGRRFTLSADESPVRAQQAAIDARRVEPPRQRHEVRRLRTADRRARLGRCRRRSRPRARHPPRRTRRGVRPLPPRHHGTGTARLWARVVHRSRCRRTQRRHGVGDERRRRRRRRRVPPTPGPSLRLVFLPTSDARLSSLTRTSINLDSVNRAAGATPARRKETEMTNPRRIAGGIAAAVLGGGATAALLLGPATTSASTPTSTEVAATVDEPDDTTATAEESGDTATPTEETGEGGSLVREPFSRSSTTGR